MALPYALNPMGINKNTKIPLTFTADRNNVLIWFTANGAVDSSGILYRLGTKGRWLNYTMGTRFTLQNGESVQFWNTRNQLSLSTANYFNFGTTTGAVISGNIQSLLNYRQDCPANCFTYLFTGARYITNAPELPATTIGERSYFGMFGNCTSLIRPPSILPATTLANVCYTNMFNGCTSLTSTPILPATTLTLQCYQSMFQGCTGVTSIEVNFSNWNSNANATANWVTSVASTGTFIKPSALPEQYGVSRIPTNWTVINK